MRVIVGVVLYDVLLSVIFFFFFAHTLFFFPPLTPEFENVLFVNDSPTAEIKLIDFGLSKEIKEHEHLDEGAGTIYTMAPEVIKVTKHMKTTFFIQVCVCVIRKTCNANDCCLCSPFVFFQGDYGKEAE